MNKTLRVREGRPEKSGLFLNTAGGPVIRLVLLHSAAEALGFQLRLCYPAVEIHQGFMNDLHREYEGGSK